MAIKIELDQIIDVEDVNALQDMVAVNNLNNISGSVSLNLSNGCSIRATLVGNTTFVFGDVPDDVSSAFMLHLINPGAFNITWPASVDWGDDGVPELPASGRVRLAFATDDGGVIWDAAVSFIKTNV